MYVHMCMGVLICQKKVADSLELKLQMVVSHQSGCWKVNLGPLREPLSHLSNLIDWGSGCTLNISLKIKIARLH